MGGINMLMFIYLFIQILLITFKITDVIDCSWSKVLIPTWVILGIFGVMLLLWSFMFILCVLIVFAAM